MKRYAKRMRSKPTKAEAAFRLKLVDAEIEFRTQVVIGRYIVDFVIPTKLLVIEIDGDWHYESSQQRADTERTKYLESLGLTVLRVRNSEVDSFEAAGLAMFADVPLRRYRNALHRAKANIPVAMCPLCNRELMLNRGGRLVVHGPKRARCKMSGKKTTASEVS